MTASRDDVQAKIDAAFVELAKTTSSGSRIVAVHGTDPNNWPTGHWRNAGLGLLAARAEVGELVDPADPIPTPPPATGFVGATAWPRPTFTPARTVRYHDEATFRSAITNLQADDLIEPESGCGLITIQSASTTPFNLGGKNPSGPVVVDLGVAKSIWGTPVSPDRVKFSYTGKGLYPAFDVSNCSNLRLYGGELTTGEWGGNGIIFDAPCPGFLWYDFYINMVGASGVATRAGTAGGDASRMDLRGEVNRWCMNPAHDNHNDKGTGFHALILHGNPNLDGSRFANYGHDPLQPGETSAGQKWPEGGGGGVIEVGQNVVAGSKNMKLYALGERTKMICNATNPGSSGSGQTGGNVIQFWGNDPASGTIIGWVEGRDISGQVVHGIGSAWLGSPPVTVEHGRHVAPTNTAYPHNGLSSASDPYDRRWGIVYNDCS